MHHYAIEWQGQARGGTDDGKATALAAAEQARASATEVDDAGIRAAVANWRRQVQSADMSYRKGAEPPGRGDLEATAESLLVPRFITLGSESPPSQRAAGNGGLTPERFGTGH